MRVSHYRVIEFINPEGSLQENIGRSSLLMSCAGKFRILENSETTKTPDTYTNGSLKVPSFTCAG